MLTIPIPPWALYKNDGHAKTCVFCGTESGVDEWGRHEWQCIGRRIVAAAMRADGWFVR